MKEETMRPVILAAAIVLMLGPANAQDKATIDKFNAAFVTAFNKGDFATVGNMYTEDAYLLPAGSPMVKGRSNIQAFWTKAGEGIGGHKPVHRKCEAAWP
jgi:ketosteroid isomerase-like protein